MASAEFLGRFAGALGGALHVHAVLVGAGGEHGMDSPACALKRLQQVGHDGGVGVADVRRGIDVIDRGGEVVFHFGLFQVREIGFRDDVLQRHAGCERQLAAVLVLGRVRAFAGDLHAHFAVLRFHFAQACAPARAARRCRCAGRGSTFPAKINLRHGFAVFRFGDHAQQVAGAALLHDDRLEGHVERAELQQPLGGVGQHLRVEIVDIGFDHRRP